MLRTCMSTVRGLRNSSCAISRFVRIRSYVVSEASGEVGTFCIYEAESPEAIMAHADAAELPVDEIVPVADTVIVRPDPVPVGA